MSALHSAATPARLASVAAALALLATLLVAPALRPATVRGQVPLPACRYADVFTTPRAYDDWSITLVDTILRVPKGYIPPDLVSVADLGVPGHGAVRAVMADDLKAMRDAAVAADAPIAVQSAYRSYLEQQRVFNQWVDAFGYARALEVSARPGHSEHQLGLAIDFRSQPADDLALDTDWAGTPAGKWMKAHAWEYGFLMSYPRGKMALTCYDFEPWHFRYVGVELAALIHASGLTPREYLWANFTTTVVPPPPIATPRPGSTARPNASPVPSPTASAALSPSAIPPSPTPAPTGTAATASPAVEATPAATFTAQAGDGVSTPLVLAGVGVPLVVIAVVLWVTLRKGRSGAGL